MLRSLSKIKSWIVIYVAMIAALTLADQHRSSAAADSGLSPVSLGAEASRFKVEPRVQRADI